MVGDAILVIWGVGCLRVDSSNRLGSQSVRIYFLLELLLVEDLGLCRMPTTWPKDLRLEIIEAGIGALDVQTWILHHKAPVARIRWTPKIGNQDFGELVKSLREGKCVSRHDSCQACLTH